MTSTCGATKEFGISKVVAMLNALALTPRNNHKFITLSSSVLFLKTSVSNKEQEMSTISILK